MTYRVGSHPFPCMLLAKQTLATVWTNVDEMWWDGFCMCQPTTVIF